MRTKETLPIQSTTADMPARFKELRDSLAYRRGLAPNTREHSAALEAEDQLRESLWADIRNLAWHD
jgi:hypothetical protein